MSHKKNIGLISNTSVTKHTDKGNKFNKKTKYSKLLEASRYSAYKKIIEDNNIDYNTIIDVGCSWGSYFYFYNSLFNKPKIIGIEQYHTAAKQAEELYDKVYIKSVEDLENIDENGFVCCNGMLVHILEEEEELKILKKIKEIAKGNYICVGVLNCEHYGPNIPNKWYGPNSKVETLDYYYNLFKKANLKIIDSVGTFIQPLDKNGNLLSENTFDNYFKLGEKKRKNKDIHGFSEIQFLLK